MHGRHNSLHFDYASSVLTWQFNFLVAGKAACFLKQAKPCEASTSRLFTERLFESMLRMSHLNKAICVIPMTKSFSMIHDMDRKSYFATGEEKLSPRRFAESAYDRFSLN